MDLNHYGAACRCLLRLRENEGKPALSDAAFIQRFLPRYPTWRERPGEADLTTVIELARELQIADHVESFRDYHRILEETRRGASILVYTERTPEQSESTLRVARHVMLMVAMDEDAFTLWCPYPSGNSETLPRAKGVWWDRWLSIGLVLSRIRTK